jgi:hypothetical protein
MIPEKPAFNRFRAWSGVFLQARWAVTCLPVILALAKPGSVIL